MADNKKLNEAVYAALKTFAIDGSVPAATRAALVDRLRTESVRFELRGLSLPAAKAAILASLEELEAAGKVERDPSFTLKIN